MVSNFVQKIIISSSLIGSLLIYLSTIDFGTILLRFVTIGEIPGTSYTVSADAMLWALLVVAFVSVTPMVINIYRDIQALMTLEQAAAKSTRRKTAVKA